MKYILLLFAATVTGTVFGQVKVSKGDISSGFTLTKQPVFNSYSTETDNYFVTVRQEGFDKINNLIVADNNGKILLNKDISINPGMMNNQYELNGLLVLGNKTLAFVENHNKGELANTLTVRTLNSRGEFDGKDVLIGRMPIVKFSNPGSWAISLTPDKKHVAIIGINPYTKGVPTQVNYFILDADLKETSKGNFNFASETKELRVFDFLASDQNDLYIISRDYDKTYLYPVIYKFTAGTEPSIIPVMIQEPDLKNLSYTYKVNQKGELVIAGYTQKKSTLQINDVKAVGTWLFNSSNPAEVKTFNFDTPVTNLNATDIVFNGDTFYLVGEQYLKEKDKSDPSTFAMAAENYNYTHGDIEVTGFSLNGDKKFDVPINRFKRKVLNTDQALTFSSGIIDGKLALIYNDQYGKYVDDERYRKDLMLPVATLITNDGLMEAPAHFEKQLDVVVSTYFLYPQFFVPNQGKIFVLSGNKESVKVITFNK